MKKKLEVYFNKTSILRGIMSMLFVLGILFLSYLGLYWLGLLITSIKIILNTIALIIFISMFSISISMKDNHAATLNEDGIFLKGYGFISWKHIKDIYLYSLPNLPIEMIGIKLDPQIELPKESSIFSKFRVTFARKLGHPDITLSGLTTSNDKIINFYKDLII